MKEIFDYEGVNREELQEAMEIVGEEKFTAIFMLATSEMIEEHADELLEQAEEAREKAKELLKEEVEEA